MLLSAFIPESNEGASSKSGQFVKSTDQPVVGLTNSRGNSFAFRVDSMTRAGERESRAKSLEAKFDIEFTLNLLFIIHIKTHPHATQRDKD